MTEPTGCPFHGATTTETAPGLPGDGTPLRPSPSLAAWREVAPATPLAYQDGHEGLIVTGYDLGRAVLEDRRFSMRPARMPAGPGSDAPASHTPEPDADAANPAADRTATEHADAGDADAAARRIGDLPGPELDAAARRSEHASLLGLDGEEHARLRRSVTSRFSVKQARGRQPWVAGTVAATLDAFRAAGAPNDLWRNYAQPIAAAVHCRVLGVPEDLEPRFVELFVGGGPAQTKYEFIREVIARREIDPGEDVVTDLLRNEAVSREEAEGLLLMLMSSGRDSVAYLISTAAVALLTHPEQLAALRDDPERIGPAIEEFMRTGAMFVTLFPRTALEDVELAGVRIPAGTTVSVSSVAANRDPARWEDPETFDVDRDAFGHVGFGHGIHGCIGQQLARVEIREGITQLLLGLPGLRLVEAEQLAPLPFAHPVATYEAGAVIVAWDA